MPWKGEETRAIRAHHLELEVLPELYAVCRLAAPADASWARGTLWCVMRSQREAQGVTVICAEAAVPDEGVEADRGWHAIRFVGAFDFGEVGVLASVLNPLGRAGVPAMTVSTFETDYVLVKANRFERVRQALEEAGHRFVNGVGTSNNAT